MPSPRTNTMMILKVMLSVWLPLVFAKEYGLPVQELGAFELMRSKAEELRQLDTSDWANDVCPDPKDIRPCACYFMDGGSVMDCSKVRNEDDLLEVFSRDLTFTNYGALRLFMNNRVQTIRKGDLGKCTFRRLRIELCKITSIDDAALLGSQHTLTDISITESNFKKMPDVSYYTKLKTIDLTGNSLIEFPPLVSESLLRLDLSVNNITDIPQGAMQALPSLREFEMIGTFLTEVKSGTFTNNEDLEKRILSDNGLVTIPDDAIQMKAAHTSLYLENNQITYLPYGAVSSITDTLSIRNNLITEVPEEVYKPLLEKNVKLYMDGNPLACGCDIAWLILNSNYLSKLGDFPRCADGVPLIELDPLFYDAICNGRL